jgi:hypothetical protein
MQELIRSQSWNEEFWVAVWVAAILMLRIVAGADGNHLKR